MAKTTKPINDPRKEAYLQASLRCREIITMLTQVEGLCERAIRDTNDAMEWHTDITMNGYLKKLMSLSERMFYQLLRASMIRQERISDGTSETPINKPDDGSEIAGPQDDPGGPGRSSGKRKPPG